MKLVRFNDPFGLTSLHSQLDDIVNGVLSSGLPQIGNNLPAMDVYIEDDSRLVTEVQAPGFDKDDIQISVHEGVLEIRGQHREKEEDRKKKRSYMVREAQSSFYRRIMLPKQADGDKVEAHFDNGLLRVVIPYKELPAPKKIAIQAGKKK